MLKFISAVIAAATLAGGLTLWATNMRLDATPARDAAPQSAPVSQTAPALAAAAISPELVRLGVARDLAVIRNSIEQLAAKQEQMAQNIATLQAAEQDIIQKIPASLRTGLAPAAQKSTKGCAPETRRAGIVCVSADVPSPMTATSR
jgi:hypothetical protein